MKPILTGAFLSLTLGASSLLAVDYSPLDAEGIIVTGVRSTNTSTDDVVLTASYKGENNITYAAIYSGSLQGSLTAGFNTGAGSWTTFLPDFGSAQAVTNATLYGPNTSAYTSGIGSGNVIAVGSYKYGSSGDPGADLDHGLIYQGSVTGGGTYTQIDATPLATAQGATLRNTIAHSNMGKLVVGNYDTGEAGRAFVYDMSKTGDAAWTNLNPTGSSTQPVSITAYGIWQNSEYIYTIAGGISEPGSSTTDGLDSGYLVNYDSRDGTYSHYATFQYGDQPLSSLISHFDGITATEDGFNLTGDYIELGGGIEGGFFANVKVNPLTGAFEDITWTQILVPGADATSGNTVVGNNVLGIYVTEDGSTSYLATVPEPSTYALLALGAGVVLLGARARSRAAKA